MGASWGHTGGVLGGFLGRPGEILDAQRVSQRRFGGLKRRLKCQQLVGQPKNAKNYNKTILFLAFCGHAPGGAPPRIPVVRNQRKRTKTNENQRKPTKTDSQRTIFAENRLVWGGKGGERSHSLMTPDKQGSADIQCARDPNWDSLNQPIQKCIKGLLHSVRQIRVAATAFKRRNKVAKDPHRLYIDFGNLMYIFTEAL